MHRHRDNTRAQRSRVRADKVRLPNVVSTMWDCVIILGENSADVTFTKYSPVAGNFQPTVLQQPQHIFLPCR